jgi:transcriptional regulator with XRE-family HTH domain
VVDDAEEMAERLVTTLRYRRQDLGVTQQQVADAIGLTRVQVTNIEAGRGVSLGALCRYAMFVGLELDWVRELA